MAAGGAVTGEKVVDERLREPVEIFAVHTVLEPGEGRGTCQVLRGLQGGPLHAELKQGVVPEAIRIIAVGIPGGNLVDPLRKEVPEGVVIYDGCRLSCTAAARRSVRPIWRSIPRSKRAPKSDDKAPPSKSARTVYPARGGKRSCSGVESR